MKGKGKKGRDSDDECPLQLLDFEPLDHSRVCPRFAAVLNRTEDEAVGLEDLDVLQAELEALLVSVTKRQMHVETEMDTLTAWQESQNKPKDNKKPSMTKPDTSSGKRSKAAKDPIDEKPPKKQKSESSSSSSSSLISASTSSTKSHMPKPKSKNVATKVQEFDYSSATQLFRNDIPDRYFRFIEPYCAPIKTEQVKMLQEMIKNYDDDGDFYKVPGLGKHYSLKWAAIDGIWDNGKKDSPRKKGLSQVNRVSAAEKARLTKRAKDPNKVEIEKGCFGSFTARLISGLIEDHSTQTDPFEFEDIPGKNGNGTVLKNLSLGNCVLLEKRIKKELEDNGLLELSDALSGDSLEEDEILKELTKCQSDLRMVTAQNKSTLKLLLSKSKQNLAKQEIKKKVQAADTEVTDTYRRFVIAKQKKRNLTKKEKDMAAKAVKDRDALVAKLDSPQQSHKH